jgi:ATP-dependent RNA helicase RhlE
MLKDIEKLIKQKLPQEIIAGFEPDPNAVAQPIQLRSQQHQQSRKSGGSGMSTARGKPAAKRSSPAKKSFKR